MPRSSDRSRRRCAPLFGPVLLVGATLLAGCGDAPVRLTITLERGTDHAGGEAQLTGLEGLRVSVRQASKTEPQVFETFPKDDAAQKELPAEVPPGEPFYVDVWGCTVIERCRYEDVVGRGCTGLMTVEEGQDQAPVFIQMHDAVTDEQRNLIPCPPEI